MRMETAKKRGNENVLLNAPFCEIPKVGFFARLPRCPPGIQFSFQLLILCSFVIKV